MPRLDPAISRQPQGAAIGYSIPLRTRFRGLTRRTGLLLRGNVGWGDYAPFDDYDESAAATWLRASREAADLGWPAPVRAQITVNVTVPAVNAAQARAITLGGGGARTAKIKVADRGPDGQLESIDAEAARVAAVRDALTDAFGAGVGRIRVDANGAWTVAEAVEHLRELDDVAGGLEYAEQPCATVEELATLRRELARAGLAIPVAADESIRRAADPLRVVALDGADIAVLKVHPLGGVRACLRLAEQTKLPVVVSSALETSIGIAAGLALAGALPQLPYACGLATTHLLAVDVIAEPLLPVDGLLPVLPANHPRLTPTISYDSVRVGVCRDRSLAG